jgi:hypothetical protein
MPCERNYDLILRAITEDQISEAEKRDLKNHIAECGECRELYDQLDSDHRVLTGLPRQYQKTIASIENRVRARLNCNTQKNTGRQGDHVKNVPWLRLVAMILILCGITLIINLIYIPQVSFSDWDAVYANVAQAKSVTWDQSVTGGSLADQQMALQISLAEDYGFRVEATSNGEKISTTYYEMKTKELYAIIHPSKSYIILPVDMEAALATNEGQDLRKVLKDFLQGDYKELGEKTHDGVRVAGVRADSREMFGAGNEIDKAELWVDVETKLPVKMILQLSAAESGMVTMVMENIRWDVYVDASYYRPVIPESYKLQMRFHPVVADEANAIAGLKAYADIVGFYPDVLNTVAPMEKAESALGSNVSDEKTKELYRILSAIAFQQKLLSNKQKPAYFGQSVQPGDTEKVLWEWQLEDGKRRLVYGDLRVATMK